MKGKNCGGRTYGYRHVPEEHPTERDEYGRPKILAVTREIDPVQAKWVRQIFQWYADGRSPRWIVGELNRLGVPAPGAAYKRKRKTRLSGTWSPSALHGDAKLGTGILHNPLYMGKMIWNRCDWVKNPETERRVPRLRPKDEWIEKDLPALRIIDQALWERVQTRQQSRPPMQPGTRVLNVRYLLSGLLICGVCGSRFIMTDTYRYACAGARNRKACSNVLRVPRELVEARCLDGLRRELFTEDRYALFVKEMTRLLAERKRQQGPDRGRAQQELATVESEITNLLNAIKRGIVTVSTKAELETLEAKRERLHARLQDGAEKFDKVVALLPRVKERYEALVQNLAHIPQRHIEPMREQIKSLVGEITLRPKAEGYLEAEMVGRYDGLLKLAVGGNIRNVVGCGGRI